MTNGNHWRPYPERRESSIGWLGEIPSHWELYRLRHVATIQSGLTLGRNLEGRTTVTRPYLRVANVQDGYLDLDSITTVDIPPDEVTRYELKKGDVLMTEGGDFDKLGRGYVWEGQVEGCLHQNHVFAVRPLSDRLDPYYLALLTSSLHGKNYFTSTSQQTTNLATINRTKLGNFPIVLPPFHEQRQIIAWLAQQLAKIDALIAKKQRLIELLQEKRTALISHAVTKGLDAGVAMKESGVAWLGEVPAHWEVQLIKRYYQVDLGKMLNRTQETGGHSQKPYLRAANVRWEGIDVDDVNEMEFGPLQLERYRLTKGDLLITEGGVTVGRSAIWNEQLEECYYQNSLNRARSRGNASTKLLYYWMYFLKENGVIDIVAEKSTFCHLTNEKANALPLVLPPEQEASEITRVLDDALDQIATITERVTQVIAVLQEYRTALISAAVTGKIDVRENDHS